MKPARLYDDDGGDRNLFWICALLGVIVVLAVLAWALGVVL